MYKDFVDTRNLTLRTRANKFIDLDNFKVGDLTLDCIASSLAKQCRFAGHCRGFYSIAEHSVLVAKMAIMDNQPPMVVKWCLMHDSPEAVVSDVPKPVKIRCKEFNNIESGVSRVLCLQFGLPVREPTAVHIYDQRAVEHELYKLFPHIEGEYLGSPTENELNPIYLDLIEGLDYHAAKRLFMRTAREIGLV